MRSCSVFCFVRLQGGDPTQSLASFRLSLPQLSPLRVAVVSGHFSTQTSHVDGPASMADGALCCGWSPCALFRACAGRAKHVQRLVQSPVSNAHSEAIVLRVSSLLRAARSDLLCRRLHRDCIKHSRLMRSALCVLLISVCFFQRLQLLRSLHGDFVLELSP